MGCCDGGLLVGGAGAPAVSLELCIGPERGAHRYPQITGEFSRRRKDLPDVKIPAGNCCLNLFRNLHTSWGEIFLQYNVHAHWFSPFFLSSVLFIGDGGEFLRPEGWNTADHDDRLISGQASDLIGAHQFPADRFTLPRSAATALRG